MPLRRVYNSNALALTLKDRRKSRKMSQGQAAALVGLRQMTISAFENNPDGTKLETLFQILAALNMDLYLVPREEEILFSPKPEW